MICFGSFSLDIPVYGLNDPIPWLVFRVSPVALWLQNKAYEHKILQDP